MRNFSKKLKVNFNSSSEFFFHRVFSASGVKLYSLLVRDVDGTPIRFDMEDKDGKWKIANTPEVPDWILKLEPRLNSAITEHTFA